MPASFIIPPADNYQGLAVPLESRLLRPPPEGNRVIPVSINWGNDSPTNQAISFNFQNNNTQPFSQLCGAYVDNLQSNVDAVFMFNDTQSIVEVPASTAGWYPFDTNVLSFIVRIPFGQVGTNTDVLRVNCYNYLPPPVSIEAGQGATGLPALVNNIALTNGTTTLIPASSGANGVITGIAIAATDVVGGGGAGDFTFLLQDGASRNLAQGGFGVQSGIAVPFISLFNMSGMSVGYIDGLKIVRAATGTAFAGGTLTTNIYYRSNG